MKAVTVRGERSGWTEKHRKDELRGEVPSDSVLESLLAFPFKEMEIHPPQAPSFRLLSLVSLHCFLS